MKLTPAAEQKLKWWWGPDTWHTSHDNDMDRWYQFVDQYPRDHGFTIDETGLREHIEAEIRAAGRLMNDDLSDIIRSRISLMYRILDFLKTTER